MDLPGYGYARVSKSERDRWASLVEGYFAQDRNIALVIQLVDMRHKPTADDLQMVNFLLQTGRPFIVVCTKSDKLNRTENQQQTGLFDELFRSQGISWLPFSAVKGVGLEDVKQAIENAVGSAQNIETKGGVDDDFALPWREQRRPFGDQRLRYPAFSGTVRHAAVCDERG